MHDIKAIRDNPTAYDAGWSSRGLSPQSPTLLALDQALRAAQTAVQTAQSRRNEASKLIGQAKAQKDEAKAAALSRPRAAAAAAAMPIMSRPMRQPACAPTQGRKRPIR